jgi:release factor glutamine methyltransferase
LQDALEIAKRNAAKNETVVEFIQADILEFPELQDRFDMIVSNLPYVREIEKRNKKCFGKRTWIWLCLYPMKPTDFFIRPLHISLKDLNQEPLF